jgi:tetratricopeptide (TPR) repeat protein
MSPRATTGNGGLPLADWLHIDEACDQFEDAWRAGARPDPAAFLDDAPGPARARLLRELLALELEYRLGRGARPDAARFPDPREAIDPAFVPHRLGTELTRADLGPAALGAVRSAGYEVLGELGRGGMSVVYLARNVALNRLCALKMIQAGAHAGASALARFQAEAEAIARLRHPNIVQINHVGEADGLPFLELEYLPGGSLDTRLEGTPRPAVAAMRLVEVLAGALAEAHRRGIVHRDLKPANILLDADGQPKVADFGLAKILDADAALTKTQAVLGSPSYMAPEQAEGHSRRVAATTDVYALGAILYELLTGRPPFRAATMLETLAQVQGVDPVAPSHLQPGVPRDLETVCLKCLEKAPARRYATAEALAEDLRRCQVGEPILARPARSWERCWRWARRRPALAAALAVSGAAVALMLGGAFYYNAQLRIAVEQARSAERSALEQRNRTLRALNQLVYGVQEKLGRTPATRPLRRDLLDTAIAGLDAVAQGAGTSSPDLTRAVAHQELGEIFRQVGRSRDARRQLEEARRLAEDLVAAWPREVAIKESLIKACLGLGELSLMAGRFAEAKTHFRRAVELTDAIAVAVPRRAAARRGVVEAYLQLGRAFGFNGELDQAAAWFRKTRDLARRWAEDEPGNTEARDILATSYRKLADMRKLGNDPEAARSHYLTAIAIGREVLAAEPSAPEFQAHLAIAVHDLAGLAYHQGRFREARPLFQEAERLLTALIWADPDDLKAQLKLVAVHRDLGNLERDEQRSAAAADLYRLALERLLRLEGEGRLEGLLSFQSLRILALKRDLTAGAAAFARPEPHPVLRTSPLDQPRTAPPRDASGPSPPARARRGGAGDLPSISSRTFPQTSPRRSSRL